MKIALCFLISYDHVIHKEDIWIQWINEIKDIINVYIHYTDYSKIKSSWIRSHILPEKYIWCNAPYNTVDVIVKLYNKHMDILLWEYPCYGVYRGMNNLMNNMDETKIVGKNKYVIPILPYNLCDKIYDEWKDIEALKITISVYKKNKKEILCWHGDADKLLLEYISDDLIKVSIVPKNDKIIIDANMQIEL